MSLSDQIAKGQERVSLLVNGLQELNQDRLMQEEANTMIEITQTFDLLIQILVERKEDLLHKTKEIYQEAFASLFQRRKDTLEEESNKAAPKPLFLVEADINTLKDRYDELIRAANVQLEEIANPVCDVEFDHESFLKGFISGDMDGISKPEKMQKCHISKSQSQSINNDSECPSPDIDTERPNTSVNMGSDTPILCSPDKQRRQPLPMREYLREPSGYHRSTQHLDTLGEYPHTENSDDLSHGHMPYIPLERHRAVNGDVPFIRKSISSKRSNLTVIQTNYPNSPFHNAYSSPQLSRKNNSVKTNKNLKKLKGEMECSAVGMGVRRVNSCDATEIIDSNPLQRVRVREKLNRRDSDLKMSQDDNDVFHTNGRRRGDKKDSMSRSKKSDSTKSVRDMVRMFSLNSKQRCTRTETKI